MEMALLIVMTTHISTFWVDLVVMRQLIKRLSIKAISRVELLFNHWRVNVLQSYLITTASQMRSHVVIDRGDSFNNLNFKKRLLKRFTRIFN
jgi:hypothetical protein